MKKFIPLSFLIYSVFLFPIQAQNGAIDYNFHLNLQNYEEGYIYSAKLLFTNTESLFVYNSAELEGKPGFRKMVKYRSGNINGAMYSRSFDEVGNINYTNLSQKEMISREILNGKYPVEVKEPIPSLDWTITEETKKIGKFTCYKAELKSFRGRNYTAWFTYELPVSIGPWKLQGLPGLILEAYDDDAQIHIVAESIKYNAQGTPITIEKPQEKEVIDLDEFLEEKFRLYKSYIENQKALYATDRIKRKVTPLPYHSMEYNKEQEKQLNEVNAIVLSQ